MVGGRLFTEQIGAAVFDHGAQFFTVRSAEFELAVDHWTRAGLVGEWCRGFTVVDGYPRYRANAGMQSLAIHLAGELTTAGVEILPSTAVRSVSPDPAGQGWTVTVEAGDRQSLETDAVVLTPPAPFSAALIRQGGAPIDPEVLSVLDGVGCHRVLALLAVVDRPAALPPPGAHQQPDDPTFSFIADNQAKGVSGVPAVTFHTAHQRSAELWEEADDVILATLLPEVTKVVAPARTLELQLRRWPCSGPVNPHPDPYLELTRTPGPLIVAGDGFGPSKVEGAYLSGLAAARAVAADQS